MVFLDLEGGWFCAMPLGSRSNGEMSPTGICEAPFPPCVCGRVCTISPVSMIVRLYARSRQRSASQMVQDAESRGGIAYPTDVFCILPENLSQGTT